MSWCREVTKNVHYFFPGIVLAGGLKEGSNLRRNMDPGAGASTSYNNFTFIATTNITAGQELFAPIGKSWYAYYENLVRGERIAYKEDYEFVDKLILALSKFIEDHPELSEAQFLGMDTFDGSFCVSNDIIMEVKRLLNELKIIKIYCLLSSSLCGS